MRITRFLYIIIKKNEKHLKKILCYITKNSYTLTKKKKKINY